MSKPFFGETTDRSEAFRDFKSIDLIVTQDPWNRHARFEYQRESHYTLATIQRHQSCLNPRCQQGGLDLQRIIMFQPDGEHEFWCNGDEGTPKGRRQGDPCDNRFTVKLKTIRSDATR